MIVGIILKKFNAVAGEPAPIVMELPAYHAPLPLNVLRTTWERGWSFVKRAGTVIVAAGIVIWVLNSISFEGGIHYITEQTGGASVLEVIGSAIAFLFAPLGFGKWQTAVATILGLMAKEEIVGAVGTLSSMLPEGADLMAAAEGGTSEAARIIGLEFFGGSKLSAFSFLIFNLLCAPCFAAMGAIKREMNNGKWTAAAIGWMCAFAYAISLIVYQIGMLCTGVFTVWTVLAFLVLALLLYLLLRKNKYSEST